MDEQIVKFFSDLDLGVEKIIAKRPNGVSAAQIEAAIESVYEDRDKIAPIHYAREAFRRAKEIDARKYEGFDAHKRELSGRIDNLNKQIFKWKIVAGVGYGIAFGFLIWRIFG
jgi:hypothetical protein